MGRSKRQVNGALAAATRSGQVRAMSFRLDRALIAVRGADALAFLNNLLTQDLARLGEAGVMYAALLSPQGKLIADMHVWAAPEGALLELDQSRAEEALRRLGLYKLRAQATLERVRQSVLWSEAPFAGARADPRFPDGRLGWRAIADATDAPDGAARFNTLRIAAGVPDLAVDAAPEEVLALEALLEEMHGVDFQKGCFIGQENVSRMKRRATTRRKFCPVTFDGPPLTFGASISSGDAELGTVRSSVSGRAIALLRLDRAREAGATLSAEGRALELAAPDWLILPDSPGSKSAETPT